jgi:hypothetical protein
MTDELIPEQTASCRGCGRQLRGKPYYMGGQAFHPETGAQCPANYYGGFVCSKGCDRKASLELEQSMPGHGLGQKSLSLDARKRLDDRWGNE